MVNRGYSSCSAMYEAHKRLKREQDKGKETYILYLGDHDPSGIDMIRDIRDRLTEFGVNTIVKPIALTQAQIKQFNPPPNPAKFKDPRSTDYVSKYGQVAWEVDALEPKVLNQILTDHIEGLIDLEFFQEMLNQEKDDMTELEKMKDYTGDYEG